MVIKNPCQEGFDEDHFVWKLQAFKILYYYSLYVLRSNNFLRLPEYTLFS